MSSYFENEMETPRFDNLSRLAENLVYRLPGCSDLMVVKTLRDVYRDFCRRSCCLRTKRRILLEPHVDFYQVVPVYGQIVESVTEVAVANGRHVLQQGRDYRVLDGHRSAVVIDWRFVPHDEKCRESIVVSTIEMPSLESDRTPDWFIQKHGDAVCNGAMARLSSMANKPWSDPQAATQYRLQYENAVGAAYLTSFSEGQQGIHPHDNPAAAELV